MSSMPKPAEREQRSPNPGQIAPGPQPRPPVESWPAHPGAPGNWPLPAGAPPIEER
jgi:hypothetical protein